MSTGRPIEASHRSFRGPTKRQEQLYQCGLARPIGPEQTEDLSFRDPEGDVVDGPGAASARPAGRVNLANVLKSDGGHELSL